ncbi:hypothetical protein [Photobacterium aquimaris]|uniref:Uncharacterized protein n=1 Tax=Photobacterium aquimaris TaxID=512643 RepID=A0A2T3HX60_9GAMM|nr:hypothetical protein [Photobacterium aquimaris]OBU24677.1 hypothetical protein AYY21_11305 [Photobacterium aquimaris]PQJ38493.1 hypothetical protein BTN98_13860 [Photobacterium aquimaris]PSU03794.1 hypothetical protein C0W81_11385 [Photobacterium aquimaris]
MNISTMRKTILATMVTAIVTFTGSVSAHTSHSGGIQAKTNNTKLAPFDIIHTKITTKGNVATFHIAVSGKAGEITPTPIGKLAGSDVFSYVWPLTLNSHEVGFEKDAGILALAVTSHPDFDDTPQYDENGDGDKTNDGNVWHSHWVVLAPNKKCGPDALGVVDIPKGEKPRLPKTWPGLPLLIDSPNYQPQFRGHDLNVKVRFDNIEALKMANFDGVTAGLRINASAHSPLLCVKNVFDIASGDLSLSGKTNH